MARLAAPGEVAEWLKAADGKSARASVRWFESSPLHQPHAQAIRGIAEHAAHARCNRTSSSFCRAIRQADCLWFESSPLGHCPLDASPRQLSAAILNPKARRRFISLA